MWISLLGRELPEGKEGITARWQEKVVVQKKLEETEEPDFHMFYLVGVMFPLASGTRLISTQLSCKFPPLSQSLRADDHLGYEFPDQQASTALWQLSDSQL
jgi:hypothetical protein